MTSVPRSRNDEGWAVAAERLRVARGGGRGFVRLLGRAAAAGEGEAMWRLGNLFDDGFSDADGTVVTAPSPRLAVRWFRQGAMRGHTGCMVSLAVRLSSGRGVRRDVDAALRWERKAVRMGDPVAAVNLAQSYRVKGDHRAAFRWLRTAAAMGNDVDLEIGKALLLGVGTRRDVAAGVAALKRVEGSPRVSEGERIEARLLLAMLYRDGSLVPFSYREHERWLGRAAERGSAIAALMLKEGGLC